MADEWPEFSIPQMDTPPAQEHAPEVTTDSTPPTTPVDTGQAAAAPGTEDFIPKYRYDETAARLRQAEQMLMEVLRTQAAAAKPPAPPEDDTPLDPDAERKQALYAQFLDLHPNIQKAMKMAEQYDAISKLIERDTQSQQAQQAMWDAHNKQVVATLHDTYAKLVSNGQKTGKDLPPDVQRMLVDNFIGWITRDQTKTLEQRYEQRDPALLNEFMAYWQQSVGNPWRRQTAAAQVQQARRVASLPVGGGTASPLGTPPAKPKPSDDEDEVFHRAFRHSMAMKDQMDQTV